MQVGPPPTDRAVVEAILDGCERLLVADGHAALTPARIAAEGGVTPEELARFFPDRAAVVVALCVRFMSGFAELMDDLIDQARRQLWDDTAGVLLDAFAEHYREAPAFRALWFSPEITYELREADRVAHAALADGVERVLAQRYELERGGRLATVALIAVLTADAVLQAAFRADPQGDPDLLEEGKEMLRARLDRLVAPGAAQA